MVGPESAEIEDLKALRRRYPNIMLHACLEFCSSQSIERSFSQAAATAGHKLKQAVW